MQKFDLICYRDFNFYTYGRNWFSSNGVTGNIVLRIELFRTWKKWGYESKNDIVSVSTCRDGFILKSKRFIRIFRWKFGFFSLTYRSAARQYSKILREKTWLKIEIEKFICV